MEFYTTAVTIKERKIERTGLGNRKQEGLTLEFSLISSGDTSFFSDDDILRAAMNALRVLNKTK